MLTDRAVKSAKPADKPYKMSDSDGLYLLVDKNGSKLWRLNYRFADKHRTYAIGRYPEVTLQQAREKNLEAKRLLADGVDPSSHKRAKIAEAKIAAGYTFKSLAEEYIETLENKGYAAHTIYKNRWILMDIACPKIGRRPIADIRPKEILDLLRSVEKEGKLETARRTRTVIGSVFRLAALTDRALTDPTAVLRKATKAPRVTHRAAIIQPERFGELLRAIDKYEHGPSVKCALQTLALTFVRPGEVRHCMWSDIDLEEGVWRIPAHKTKMKRPLDVPITPQFRLILKEISPYSRKDSYVFPSPRSFVKPMGNHTLSDTLAFIGFKNEMSAHGFRSSASSMLNELGYRADVIEMQLGHVERNDVRRAYNRALYWNERVAMMSEWAKYLDRLRLV